MLNYLAAFSSRSQAFKFYELCKNAGCSAQVVNRGTGAGCCLSVSIAYKDYDAAAEIISSGGFNTFKGFTKESGSMLGDGGVDIKCQYPRLPNNRTNLL